MAYHDTTSTQGSDLPHRIVAAVKSFFTVIGTAIVAGATANRRIRVMENLNAKSDAQLARMGLRREDIVRHVFIDMLDV
jgi:hypothetical protein